MECRDDKPLTAIDVLAAVVKEAGSDELTKQLCGLGYLADRFASEYRRLVEPDFDVDGFLKRCGVNE